MVNVYIGGGDKGETGGSCGSKRLYNRDEKSNGGYDAM